MDRYALRNNTLQKQQVSHAIKNYLQEHLDRSPTVEDIAQNFLMSPRTFSRRLNHFGLTFRDILAETRCNEAKKLLRKDESSVQEIATKVGYADTSNFIKAFKREVGLTPRQYRHRQPPSCFNNPSLPQVTQRSVNTTPLQSPRFGQAV